MNQRTRLGDQNDSIFPREKVGSAEPIGHDGDSSKLSVIKPGEVTIASGQQHVGRFDEDQQLLFQRRSGTDAQLSHELERLRGVANRVTQILVELLATQFDIAAFVADLFDGQ